MSDDRRLHDVLSQIARLAGTALGNESEESGEGSGEAGGRKVKSGCTLKSLPRNLLIKAAETAVKHDPANAPVPTAGGSALAAPLDPLHIAVMTSKYWGPATRRLTVSFMETTSAALRRKIVEHLNAWNRTAGISFVETNGTGNIRISRGSGGYYSYLGTDVLHIPTNRQTMNLEGFTLNTPESEYRRVVRHEAGHTLGFPHEHMRRAVVARIDPEKAYQYFLENYGWPRWMVDQQVLTPLDERSIFGTRADDTSIMCYQLPGSITRDGRPIPGGGDINATDAAFAGWIYPKTSQGQPSSESAGAENESYDGEESEEEFLEEPLALAD